ncbi:IclR family transcriptional regulator [Celeribacter indicus]|uniref:Regulatory protein, IclR n=1 Tax=Celeribacter indicus TaxID=1208324 RepID=A0A0B5DUK6_9RHOB|nr:IclR family transcriptional regulator [Celeribacter indicus]AJE46699.1 regulatory protein, IclR [Celeribacter indicus]SDX04262.1 transcriptional regulator, IclR family [Celeribacter indicus]
MSDTVKASSVTLDILERIAFSSGAYGVTEIARFAGVAKSAAHKHLMTLVQHGFVVQDPLTQRYRLGPKAWLLSRNAPDLDDIATVAEPIMIEARNALGLAVVLSIPIPESAFVLTALPSTHSIEIGVRTGSQLSLHASAQGKIFLAFGDELQRRAIDLLPMPKITRSTQTDREALRREIAQVVRDGYASAPEQSLLGVNALAGPVFNYQQRLIAAVGLIGSVQHIEHPPKAELVSALLGLSRKLSAAFGCDIPPHLPRRDKDET